VAWVLALTLLPGPLASAAPTRTARQAREIRATWTGEFGLPRPVGLTYLPGRGELIVAGRADPHTSLLRLSLIGDPRGRSRFPRLSAPGTLAFDPARKRLTALSQGSLITAAARDLSGPRPTVTRTSITGLGLQDPRAGAFDPGTGTEFVLDRGGDELVVLPAKGDAARISLGGLGGSGFEAIAFNSADGLVYVAGSEGVLFALDGSGDVRKTFGLALLSIRHLSAMTFAPSADPTDDPAALHLYLADAGRAARLGGVIEATLAQAPPTAAPVVTATLVQRIDTSAFVPSSPDPSGIVYLPALDQLMICDSEVDETTGAGYHGANLWRITRTGVVQDTGTTLPFTNEPTGLGFDPGTNTLFISSDDQHRIYFLRPGPDGRWGNADDNLTSISTTAFGTDTEDPEFDPSTGHLFFIDGVSTEVFDIDPVNGIFGDGNDVVTHFDVGQYGATDIEGLASDQARNTLLVGNRPTKMIYEVTKAGALVRTIDASGIPGMRFVSGLGWAPASDNSGRTDYWIVDRAGDNGPNPNENDGKIFEISVPATDPLPTISSFSPTSGPVGTSVTITGTNLTGATSVMFSGVSTATFKVVSSTKITATVPAGATTGPIKVTTPVGSATSTSNFTVGTMHARSVTLKLRKHLVAQGGVRASDGFMACVMNVPIKIQRRVSGNWKTVGSNTTTATGSFKKRIPDKPGRYRAKAPKVTLNAGADTCSAATTSPVRTNR
jgi:hypothetical protein